MFQQAIQMNELAHSIDQALATGRAGTVVSARLHWEVPAHARLEAAAFIGSDLLNHAVAMTTTQWIVRRRWSANSPAGLLHLLGTDDRGRTMVVTINHGPSHDAQLTLFGNHGIIRLDRAELLWDTTRATQNPDETEWHIQLRQALGED